MIGYASKPISNGVWELEGNKGQGIVPENLPYPTKNQSSDAPGLQTREVSQPATYKIYLRHFYQLRKQIFKFWEDRSNFWGPVRINFQPCLKKIHGIKPRNIFKRSWKNEKYLIQRENDNYFHIKSL